MPSISFPLYMLACLGLTIIVEILVALIIKVRTKMDLINIVLVNIMTNPIIVALTNLISDFFLTFIITVKRDLAHL